MQRTSIERIVLAAAAAVTMVSHAAQAGEPAQSHAQSSIAIRFDDADAREFSNWAFETDTWTGNFTESGQFLVQADGEESNARYQYVTGLRGLSPDAMRGATLEVRVAGEFFGDQGAMGVVHRFNADDGSYLGFALCSGGRYCVYLSDGETLSVVMSGTSEAIRADGDNLLRVSDEGEAMGLYINGVRIGAYGSSVLRGDGVGLFQAGRGVYAFDDFTVTPVVGPVMAEQDAGKA